MIENTFFDAEVIAEKGKFFVRVFRGNFGTRSELGASIGYGPDAAPVKSGPYAPDAPKMTTSQVWLKPSLVMAIQRSGSNEERIALELAGTKEALNNYRRSRPLSAMASHFRSFGAFKKEERPALLGEGARLNRPEIA